jgi:hypothetical protein
MAGDAVGHAILMTTRIVLGVALFAGILGAFHVQRGQRRRALAGFRKVRLTGEGEVFFVRHASEQNLADRSRPFAGDAFGALTVTPRAVVFRGEPATAYANLEFLPGQAQAAWVGRRMMNGAFSWFSITARGETHYFTSAERMGTIGSRKRTRKIHDAVLAQLG